ncbi:MAG: hypothetical protein JJ975_17025 [Bacteroidia bacterium]|nr:hypothetical protein [Bacteroidia bacterium]
MRKIAVLFGSIVLGLTSQAQTIELEQDVNRDTVISDYGPNRKNFFGTYLGLGAVIGQIDHDFMKLKPVSDRFTFGAYYKRRLNNVYSVLLSSNYGVTVYRFEVSEVMKYNRIRANDVNLDFSNRFNFGRRGNRIGNYLELGVSGMYIFHTKQETKTEVVDNAALYKNVKTELTGLKFIESANYSVHARFGFNKFAITADYRLSDLTTNRVDYDLPPLTVGVRLDLGA